MINVNRGDVARKVIGVILVGVGVSLLAGVLLYLSPHILHWFSNYPAWATFLVGFVVFSLGVFLAAARHVKSAKKAQETEGDNYKEKN